MKTSISMNCLRVAALAAVTLMPGMAACTYSASSNSPTLGPAGGYVAVSIATQPGCRWSVSQAGVWITPAQREGTGSATVYIYVAPTRTARSAVERVYSDYVSTEVTLSNGTIGGRSGVTGAMIQPILQFRITEN
jgi:hypothetical protein